jgi:hypothetical protein
MIVGHVSPDWDCLTALWLLRRFDPALRDATIELVNTGNPDAAVLAAADAVVDTGRVCDWYIKRYDHHQMEDPNSTCAALLVYEHLLSTHNELSYLAPLVQLVFAGDTGKREADESRKNGIHAMVSEMKYQQFEDAVIFRLGCVLLDFIAGHLSSGIPFDAILRDVNGAWHRSACW